VGFNVSDSVPRARAEREKAESVMIRFVESTMTGFVTGVAVLLVALLAELWWLSERYRCSRQGEMNRSPDKAALIAGIRSMVKCDFTT
jgi:hypothetical protein